MRGTKDEGSSKRSTKLHPFYPHKSLRFFEVAQQCTREVKVNQMWMLNNLEKLSEHFKYPNCKNETLFCKNLENGNKDTSISY